VSNVPETMEMVVGNMPDPLKKPFYELTLYVLELHVEWKIYCQVFGHSQKRMDLLKECAAATFTVFNNALWDAIILSLNKLADPDILGKYENLSLKTILKYFEESEEKTLSAQLRSVMDDLVKECEPLRLHRNKRIAHPDLETAMQRGANLDGISRLKIDKALGCVRAFMNAVEKHYGKDTRKYEAIKIPATADGEALVTWLKDGLYFSKLPKKLGIGRNDLRGTEWDDA
jgi:hypothetical protein